MWPLASLSSALLRHWKPALCILACLACFALGYRQRGLEDAREQAAELTRLAQARRKQEEQTRKISEELAVKVSALEQHNRQLSRRLARETNDPAYRCPVPDAGLRLLRDAVSGPAGQPDGAAP